MIIPTSPNSIQDTKLFSKISEGNPENGILNKANVFIETVNPLADLIISGPFEKYTLHNRDHIKKVFHLGGVIISDKTYESLNQVEVLLFLYAAYLHDLGMAVTNDEFNKLLVDPSFIESIGRWSDLNNAIESARNEYAKSKDEIKPLLEKELFDLHKVAMANYLRPLHATNSRYAALIKFIKDSSGKTDLFEVGGQNFEGELILICESHNLSSVVLGEMLSAHQDKFPRTMPLGGVNVNVQFIAALLRVSDVLDFDFERTPKILFESLGIKYSNLPGAKVSLFEWQKHMSIKTIEIFKEEIVIGGECFHPIIESGIREFCQIIENEIHDTNSVLKRNTDDITNKYQIDLPSVVRPNLRSCGYVFMDLSLKLDEASVMSLLMGNRLYNSELIAIRELIQNGVDACLIRKHLLGEYNYNPIVQVTITKKENDYWLNVFDNGLGMDDYVLKNHFFRVGSSYYKSAEYKRLFRDPTISPPAITSRFGIGFLSVFMLGNEIEVATRKIYPGGGNSKGKKIYIEKMGALAFVQEDDSLDYGTRISVKLKDPLSYIDNESIESFIKANVIRPKVPVRYKTFANDNTVYPESYYEVNIQDKSGVDKNGVHVIEFQVELKDSLSGRVYLFLHKKESGEYSCKVNNLLIELNASVNIKNRIRVSPEFVFNKFVGNRVTVNGFKMAFNSLKKLFKMGNAKLPLLYDLDFSSLNDIDFDVSRTRILDKSLKFRHIVKSVIYKKIRESNIYDKLDEFTKQLIERQELDTIFSVSQEELRKRVADVNKSTGFLVGAVILEKVKEKIPANFWPIGFHREIAEVLGISRGQAYAAIALLLLDGSIVNPNLKDKDN